MRLQLDGGANPESPHNGGPSFARVAIYLLMFKLYGLVSPRALFASSPASFAREYLLQIRTFW